MEIVRNLPGLAAESRYIIKVRAWSQLGVSSDWSEALIIKTPADTTTPNAPTQLTIDFNTPDLILSWTAPTRNTNNSVLNDLSKYQVTLTGLGGPLIFETFLPFFTHPFSQNKAYANPPDSSFDIEIRALDTAGNISAPLTGTATHPGPFTPPGPDLEESSTTVHITMAPNAADVGEVSEFLLYHSTDNGIADPWSLIATVNNGVHNHNVVAGTTHYYRFQIRDIFARLSSFSPSNNIATVAPTGGDGQVPPTPPAPTLGSGPGQIYVDWTPIDQPLDPPIYEIHLLTDAVTVPVANDSITKVGQTTSDSFVIRKEPDNTPLVYGTNYYVRLIAKDSDFGTVGASPASSPAGPVQVEHIDPNDISIVFADTIVSGDGIINDLIVTVDPANPGIDGSIQSENYSPTIAGYRFDSTSAQLNDAQLNDAQANGLTVNNNFGVGGGATIQKIDLVTFTLSIPIIAAETSTVIDMAYTGVTATNCRVFNDGLQTGQSLSIQKSFAGTDILRFRVANTSNTASTAVSLTVNCLVVLV